MFEVEIGKHLYNVTLTRYQAAVPAKLNGPPEDCYPEEAAEIEWEPATGSSLMDNLINNLSDEMIDSITEQVYAQMVADHDED